MAVLYWLLGGFACAIALGVAPLAHWLERRSDEADRKAWQQMGGGRW